MPPNKKNADLPSVAPRQPEPGSVGYKRWLEAEEILHRIDAVLEGDSDGGRSPQQAGTKLDCHASIESPAP